MPRTRAAIGQPAEPPRPAIARERGWASQPDGLEWRVDGRWQLAELWCARWVIEVQACEVIARCEPRELGHRRWVELGSFRTAAAARAACEADAVRRCSPREEEPVPVYETVVTVAPMAKKDAASKRSIRPKTPGDYLARLRQFEPRPTFHRPPRPFRQDRRYVRETDQ